MKMLAICVTSVLVVLLSALILIYLYVKKQLKFWSERGVPFKNSHWFFGSFGDVTTGKKSLAEVTTEFYREFKGSRFFGVWQIFEPSLVIIDMEILRDILVRDFAVWSSRGIAINPDVDPLSANLINLDGKIWKSVRTKLTPTFTSGKLKQMHYLLLECGKIFEEYLNAAAITGEDIEAREMSARFTTDVIGSCAFGIQMNALNEKDSIFRKMGRKIFIESKKLKIIRLIQRLFKKLFKLLKLSIHDKDVTDFFLSITKENIEYREKNNLQRHDFMDLLKNLKNEKLENEDETQFDDALLAAQVFVFFAAGFETSSTTISYCLHELAVNQDIQYRLRDEIHRIKSSHNEEITWDGVQSMKYLDKVVQETLRKYPPIPVVVRTSAKPYRISGTDINLPKGMACIIPIYALHHDPEFYPNPDKFDPERFSDEEKNKRPSLCFIPFGAGPRVCIGSRFAEQQTKIGIIKLVDNFKISLCQKSENPLQIDAKARFLVPKNGIWIKVSKIS